MKIIHSFRTRLLAGILLASLLPVLLSSALLVQVFRIRLGSQMEREAQEQLGAVSAALDGVYDGFCQTAKALGASPYVAPALAAGQGDSGMVYDELYSATEGSRGTAQFDLYGSDGTRLYSTQSAPPPARLPTQWGVLYAARQAGALVFDRAEGGEGADAPLFRGAAQLLDAQGEGAGYLVITMTREDFQRLLEGKYGSQSDLLVLNRYWRAVYATQEPLAQELAQQLRERLLAGEPLAQAGEEFAYHAASQEGLGLNVVLRQPQALNGGTRRLLITVAGGSALACVVLSVLLSLRLSRQMFRPIARLRAGMGEVVHNNLDVYVTPGQDDELGELAQRFNGMVSALKRNQRQLVKNQQELNEAQIRLLQSQLNPHFLCNTLDTMKWISKINQVPQVALMSTDLADILRFCISEEEFVPLRREVEILRRYMEIQSIRLSDRCRFEVALPQSLEDCLVPKMILQPLVENAVLHGLEGVEDGVVRVQAWQQEGDILHISVTDNGCGLPAGMAGHYVRRPDGAGRSHLGLYNVDTILKKHYGSGYGIYLAHRAGGPGTVVTATLPLRKEAQKC